MTTAQTKISAGLMALLVLLSAAKCEATKDGSVDTDRNPADRVVDPKLARTVTIRASIANAKGIPGEVTVDVKDSKGERESSDEILSVPGGEYVQTLTYTKGSLLTIHVEVKPAKPMSGAFCSITDGPTIAKFGPADESWRAICDLVTSQ